MSFSVKATGWSGSAFVDLGNSFSFNLGYTTVAGDCIVLGFGLSDRNSNANPVVSGCGATWTQYLVDHNPMFLVAVGINCTAGGTTVNVPNTFFCEGSVAFAVLGGVASLGASSTPVTSGASDVTSITTNSLTYPGGAMVLGFGGAGCSSPLNVGPGTWNASGTWSDGGTNNRGVIVTQAIEGFAYEAVVIDYELPVNGGTTTYGIGYTGGTSSPMRSLSLFLLPATRGNMLLVMGP